MTYIYHNGGEDASNGFQKLLEELQSGDCLAVERLGGQGQRFSAGAAGAAGGTGHPVPQRRGGIRHRHRAGPLCL